MNVKFTLIASVLTAACGQVFFKKGMSAFGKLVFPSGILEIAGTLLKVVFSPFIFSGLILYVVSTLLWLFALSKTELNYAYPFTALTFILVMAASFFVFSEAIPLNRLIGGAVICLGIVITAMK